MNSLVKSHLFWLSICIAISTRIAPAQIPLVDTEDGPISGYISGDVQIFKGIPFAAPPLGDLRWKAPQPVKKWSGVLECNRFSDSPMQRNPVPFLMWTEEFITPPEKLSEDCLYLNVWTPVMKEKEKLPVFVWIYGGGFSSGSAACSVYDGEEMAKKGIVFVSINYRVGVFGFLALPELSHESENKVSGNYGLLDQIAALMWVKKNIEAFGGDPAKVTIAGQSAGAMSVCALVASPLAKGLFRGAIAQSGGILTGFMNRNYAESEKSGMSFIEKLKVSNLVDLRLKPASELINAGGNFGPVSDDYVIPKDLLSAFTEGKFNDVYILAGWVTGDGSLMGMQKITTEQYKKQAADKYGETAGEYLKLFPGDNDEQVTSSLQLLNIMQFAALPAYLWAGFSKQKAYIYQYSHIPVEKQGFPDYGAFHTSEVPFALHTLHLWKRAWRDSDFNVEKTMSEFWVNFVKTGNPNGAGLPEWTYYDKSSGSIMEIGDESVLTPGLFKNEFEFLAKDFLKKKY